MSRMSAFIAAVTLVAFLALAPAPARSQGTEMQPPKPGPNHALLQRLVGKWRAKITMVMEPGKPPMVSDGVAEMTSVSGGLWIMGTYNMTGAMPTEGHSIDGYDEAKKKFVGVWIDSWGTGLTTYEATCDPSGKKFVAKLSMASPKGEMVTTSTTTEWKDENTYVWKMYMAPEPQGDPQMEIVYTRM